VVIFLVTLFLILSENLERTIAALAGAGAMLIAGLVLGFYTEAEAIRAIDFDTLGLLLGMMLLVALLEPTGFFQAVAIWAGKLSGGKPIRLLVLLGVVTTVLSMFLANVTTVVLIAPITILISEIVGINPLPILVAEAILSNTGGVATLIGDPPNIIISSAAGFTFIDFLTHTLPVVVVSWAATLVMLRYLFRRELAEKPSRIQALMELHPREAIKDPVRAIRVLIVLGLVLVCFFLQEPLKLRPATIALGGVGMAFVWVRPNLQDTLQHVEWGVLIFFGALFVMVGGLEAAGVMKTLASWLGTARGVAPMLLGVITIWVVAGLSAVVDNVPITIALIPVIQGMGAAGIPVQSLWWALALGAGFGGNATIIGSSANIIVASLSERTRMPITHRLWARSGLPVTVVTCIIASVLYVVAFPLFRG
jgi:Na+/H+ antiporter NhaD/arsenite permease-like protein